MFYFCSGYGEFVSVVGLEVALPCNTSTWADEHQVSLILWYKESANDANEPILTLDYRYSNSGRNRLEIAKEYKQRYYSNN